MKQLFAILAFVVLTGTLSAQKTTEIKVRETNENIGGGTHNALVVTLYNTNIDYVDKAWRKELKGFGAKVKSFKGDIFADNAVIQSMSNNSMDIYAKAEKGGEPNSVNLIVGVDLGGAFLSSSQHSSQFAEMKEIVRRFAVETSKGAIGVELAVVEKELKKLEKELDNLVRTNENLHADIEAYRDKIAQAEGDIERNIEEQENKKQDIENQRRVVEEIKEKITEVK